MRGWNHYQISSTYIRVSFRGWGGHLTKEVLGQFLYSTNLMCGDPWTNTAISNPSQLQLSGINRYHHTDTDTNIPVWIYI